MAVLYLMQNLFVHLINQVTGMLYNFHKRIIIGKNKTMNTNDYKKLTIV